MMDLPPEPPLLSRSFFKQKENLPVGQSSQSRYALPLLSTSNQNKPPAGLPSASACKSKENIHVPHSSSDKVTSGKTPDVIDPHSLLNVSVVKKISPPIAKEALRLAGSCETSGKSTLSEGGSSERSVFSRAKSHSSLPDSGSYGKLKSSHAILDHIPRFRSERLVSSSSHSDDSETGHRGFDMGSYELDSKSSCQRKEPSPLSSVVKDESSLLQEPVPRMRSFHSTPDCKMASTLSVKKGRSRAMPSLVNSKFAMPMRVSRDEHERQLKELELTGDISSTSITSLSSTQEFGKDWEEKSASKAVEIVDMKSTDCSGEVKTAPSVRLNDEVMTNVSSSDANKCSWRSRYASGGSKSSQVTPQSDDENRQRTVSEGDSMCGKTNQSLSPDVSDSGSSSSTLSCNSRNQTAIEKQVARSGDNGDGDVIANDNDTQTKAKVGSAGDLNRVKTQITVPPDATSGAEGCVSEFESPAQGKNVAVVQSSALPSQLPATTKASFQHQAESVQVPQQANFHQGSCQAHSGQVPQQQNWPQVSQPQNFGQLPQQQNVLQAPQMQNFGKVPQQQNFGQVPQQQSFGQVTQQAMYPSGQFGMGQVNPSQAMGAFGMSSCGQGSAMMNPAMNQPGPMMMNPFNMMMINGKHYIMSNLIGRGGSCLVYEAVCPQFGVCAVKVVDLGGEEEAVIELYKNEIELMIKLQDSGRVVKLHDYEYRGSQLLVVMEKGETDLENYFRKWKNSGDRILPEMVKFFWRQMLKAVQVLHDAGIVHSDLKPANFLLVTGVVKLIDFGISKAIQSDRTSVTRDVVMGTLNYLSPEAVLDTQGHSEDEKPRIKVSVKSDCWSLGCILYTMVYNRTPFQHIKRAPEKLRAIISPKHAIPYPPEQIDPNLIDTLKRCLVRNPKERASIQQLLDHPYLTSTVDSSDKVT